MKPRFLQHAPVWISFSVICLVGGLRLLDLDSFQRLERMTYDMRVRYALNQPAPVATNLGFIYIDEATISAVRKGAFGYKYGLYWPRQVYGRMLQELSAQGAKAVAFDVIFGERRVDHPPVQLQGGALMESDDFLAAQMALTRNTIIAVTRDVIPPDLFATNALALGDISTEQDSDAILRRAKPFRTYKLWHPAFRQVAADPDYGVDLEQAQVQPRRIVLPQASGDKIEIPLDEAGNFDLADFGGENLPAGTARKAKPFTVQRVWLMGVVLAACELGLDLDHPEVDLPHGRITLRGPQGLARVIPVDAKGYMEIDWSIPMEHPLLTKWPAHALLEQNYLRLKGQTNGLAEAWRGKLVVVGSSAQGNDLTDRGATPLRRNALLASKHWNVANSIITGRFVRTSPLSLELGLILLYGIAAAAATLSFRALLGSALVLLLAVVHVILAFQVYAHTRFWLPVVLPVFGALVMNHVWLLVWQVVFEQADKRRVKSILSTIVSPKIVRELLQAKTLALGGARREITILFADLRGFTALTDASQERTAQHIHQHQLTGAAAEACYDEQAREILNTVNRYLGLVADTIIRADGTLDKFIGDCVMAFWGAPAANPGHAVACVRAAIEAQRATDALNRQREAENQRREKENETRAAAGLPPRPLLPVLELGTGINTGMATVGLMGAESKAVVRQGSYTVFGREVNLAQRLESLSGHGRILISETTWQHLHRDDPELAAKCIALPAATVKGIREAVRIYEVPWRPPGLAGPAAAGAPDAASADVPCSPS